jgi:hypothetical protein
MRDAAHHHETGTNDAIDVRAILTRAWDQDGSDRLWSLVVASRALRERQASPKPLDWVDAQLRGYLDSHAAGHLATPSAAILGVLADLARDTG